MRLAAAILLLLLPLADAGAQTATARVEIDHATGTSRLIVQRGTSSDTTTLGDDPTVRLDRAIAVDVRVVNTNTALYRFTSASETVALPEAQSLQGFMAKLTPYVPELRAALSRRRGARGVGESGAPSEEAIAAARLQLATALGNVERSLLGLDQAMYGENGLHANLTGSLLALEQMRRGVRPEDASAPLRRALGLGAACGSQTPVRLPTAELLLTSLSGLVSASQELQGAADDGDTFAIDRRWSVLRDSAQRMAPRVQAALSDFDPLVATAYRVERLVGIVAHACSYWSAGETKGTLTKGRSVTIQAEPRTETELARLTDRTATKYIVRVQPRSFIRPAVAFAAVAAPDARFPKYATREVPDGVQIYESGRTDRRFGIGGTLGFTWPGLDQRETRGVAVWLPEILVTAGDLTGAGIGPAVSFGFMKVGAGALWVRHESLEGARAGDVLPDESGLRVIDGYGKPRLYVSLSVFDWAPFADRLRRD